MTFETNCFYNQLKRKKKKTQRTMKTELKPVKERLGEQYISINAIKKFDVLKWRKVIRKLLPQTIFRDALFSNRFKPR